MKKDPELYRRLKAAQETHIFSLLNSRSGRKIPAITSADGCCRPLHSTVDPEKEADRIAASTENANFLVFLGLGAGFAPLSALRSGKALRVLVIDYGIGGIAELFRLLQYGDLLEDSRFTLLIDPTPEQVEKTVLELYLPAVFNGFNVFPLRARTEIDAPKFAAASAAIQKAINAVSADYSVQAHFGIRWFSNIIRNIFSVQPSLNNVLLSKLLPGSEAAICAAGPSLDLQLPQLVKKKNLLQQKLYILSTDTALPALLYNGLQPDAVVSVDCQHISYLHFLASRFNRKDCFNFPLFMDIASPPLIAHFFKHRVYFCGGHPLAAYISQNWQPLPIIDVSGGNVSHACLSIMQHLGAERISVYGADFSYPQGKIYAKGTYIFKFFEQKQNRFNPFEAGISSVLYRSPFLAVEPGEHNYYETTAMRRYRKSFEAKTAMINAEFAIVQGIGVPLENCEKNSGCLSGCDLQGIEYANNGTVSAKQFLEQYAKDILNLPLSTGGFMQNLSITERQVFITLLPLAAAIKQRNPALNQYELFEALKRHCINAINRVLNSI